MGQPRLPFPVPSRYEISCVGKRLDQEAYVLPHRGVNRPRCFGVALFADLCMARDCGTALV
jgi:hypothetical protein